MSWHLAPALVQLRTELDSRFPDRSRIYDGTIGDAAHASRVSAHNPDGWGLVRAMDITTVGPHGDEIRNLVLNAAIGNSRVYCVIHQRKIYSRRNNFVARPYAGSNPHNSHIHVSLRNTVEESPRPSDIILTRSAADTSRWLAVKEAVTPITPNIAVVKLSAIRSSFIATDKKNVLGVSLIQRALNIAMKTNLVTDGLPGKNTKIVYSAWQRSLGYKGKDADGIPGIESLTKLALRSKLFSVVR